MIHPVQHHYNHLNAFIGFLVVLFFALVLLWAAFAGYRSGDELQVEPQPEFNLNDVYYPGGDYL